MKKLKIMTMCAILSTLGSCGNAQQKENLQTEQDGNAVIENIMARRSIRQYKEQPVEREKLERIVECGINAPNGMNKQPWEIRIVNDADYINGITDVFKKSENQTATEPGFKNIFRNAPAVIFIASPKDGSGQVDCGMLGMGMVLTAQSMGLGTCCLGAPIRFMKASPEAAPYLERLEIPEGYELLYAIGVGYPNENPAAKPRDKGKIKFID